MLSRHHGRSCISGVRALVGPAAKLIVPLDYV